MPFFTGSLNISGSIISTGVITSNGSPVVTSNTTSSFVIDTGSFATTGSNSFNGNQTITGSVTSTGGFTGSLSGTATTASYISPTFISASAAAAGFGSGGGSSIATGSFATTGSNTFIGNQVISGSVTVTGSINHVGSLKTGVAVNVALNTSLANGFNVSASGEYSHAEGYYVNAKSQGSHAEGSFSSAGLPAWDTNSTVSGITQLPTSVGNITSSIVAGATVVLGNISYAANYLIVSRSFFQASRTQIEYVSSSNLNASSGVPLAIIDMNNILATYPNQTLTVGEFSHVEGSSNLAIFGHAEGEGNLAFAGHAEGNGTISRGYASHAEGAYTLANGTGSHAEGYSATASGDYSHAEGLGTVATGSYQHVQGQYNTHGDTTSLMIVGNGTSTGARKDAFKVRMSGSIVLPTTQSSAPSWTGTDGELVFATVTGNHRFYVWMSGTWRSGSLA